MPESSAKPVSSLQDLADLAGVSRATASRALNDNPVISAKTRSRIQGLAAEHGYSINRRARNFRLSRTNIVTVVFMLDLKSEQHMSDPFFLDMLGGLADALAEHDYDLLLVHAPMENPLEVRNRQLLEQSDGVIFVGQGEQHELLNTLALETEQLVVWGHPVEGKRYTLVGGDNRTGGMQATQHLLELGRRRIAFFGSTANPEIAARYEGYCEAHNALGLSADPRLRIGLPFDLGGARAAIETVMQGDLKLDAIFCASDVLAFATISALQQLNLRIPEDIAVVGYDDIALSAYGNPPITTVNQHIREAGKVLVETLLRKINGESAEDTIIGSELVVRRSSVMPGR